MTNCYRMFCALDGCCLTEHWCGFRLISSKVEPMMYAG